MQQRSEYTFKYNENQKRHGWLRLTPAYSVKLVEEILERSPNVTRVLEPFSGSGTTPLVSSYNNIESSSLDINPFLIWVGKTKNAFYSTEQIKHARELSREFLVKISQKNCGRVELPPIKNIDRWWDVYNQGLLAKLKFCIDNIDSQFEYEKNLLLMAFCRILIEVSNASFNHQSMSFKDVKDLDLIELLDVQTKFIEVAERNFELILETAQFNPMREANYVNGDARNISSHINGTFDMLITSPPYPNRMSYIRELRPYMYWLGYIKESKEAGELDWKAIGGTWGSATSRLSTWKSQGGFVPSYFMDIVNKIENGHEKNGIIMANYVAKYFEDIWLHLNSVNELLTDGAEFHYVVGNSTFYNVVLPVEKIYQDMMLEIGFSTVEIETIRKRNSKKELFEFDVKGYK